MIKVHFSEKISISFQSQSESNKTLKTEIAGCIHSGVPVNCIKLKLNL